MQNPFKKSFFTFSEFIVVIVNTTSSGVLGANFANFSLLTLSDLVFATSGHISWHYIPRLSIVSKVRFTAW